jgi:hypothetical protein
MLLSDPLLSESSDCQFIATAASSLSAVVWRLVNNLSMHGYNSHDCHTMMMVFLAIAIRAIKPVHVKVIITRLFNTVSQKVIGRKELDDLRAYMIETMCMLEMCFPPFLICNNT